MNREFQASVVAGLLFGFGLALSGVTQPQVVMGFLDLWGRWNPQLLFVLGGAVGVTLIGFRFILRRKAPLLAAQFALPKHEPIDRPLLVGSALFGIGWGIAGYCPGPAFVALAAPNTETFVFLPALLLGMLLHGVAGDLARLDRNASKQLPCD